MSTKKHIYVNPLGGVKEMEYNNVEKLNVYKIEYKKCCNLEYFFA